MERNRPPVLKFFVGVIVGAILVIVIGVVCLVALASLRSRPPSVAAGSTLVLHLNGEISERAPLELPFALGQRTPLTIEQTWSLLRKAASDKRIKAVVVEPMGAQLGWAKMQELRLELARFRQSGKPLYAYLKTPSTRDYYIATAASKIYLAPEDLLDMKGLRLELMYFKRTLDKLGVTVYVDHDGKYKDYGDMFTRTSLSPESREVYTSIIDLLYADLIKTVGVSRKRSAMEVQAAIDSGPLLSDQVLARGLVDGLCYEDEMYGKLKKELKDDVRKIGEREYLRVPESDAGINGKVRFAYVAAEGAITRGDPSSGGGYNSEGIESESFIKVLDRVANSSSYKGVIVRIDSPGGEVFASDAIWRAMNELARKKPVVISMSDAAASGGYYIAMNGTPIVAYPGTLTGSIGVVFGKPNLRGLYDKLGIDKDMLSRGRFAEIDSDYKPMDDAERTKLKEGIDQNYRDFVKKVADSRKRPVNQIEPIAQGRVWLGEQARENGLVDELGGLDRAIDVLKRKASVPATDTVSLSIYPPSRSFFDLILSSPPDASVEERVAYAFGLHRQPSLPKLLRDSSLRVWLQGGFLSLTPVEFSIH